LLADWCLQLDNWDTLGAVCDIDDTLAVVT